MRISDRILKTVCFLSIKKTCSDETVKYKYVGTGFFVAMPFTESPPSAKLPLAHTYLVTAKHIVEGVREKYASNVHVRVNMKHGGSKQLEVATPWVVSDTADVAAVSFHQSTSYAPIDKAVIDTATFATRSVLAEKRIGVGDDLMMCGLFTKHEGAERNVPIVRSGIIASLAGESVSGETGQAYPAYLIEARSIGGLSGSPVIVMLRSFRESDEAVTDASGGSFLLGMVRGHWDYKPRASGADYGDDELSAVNMGIAIVTPADDILALLGDERLVQQRREMEKEMRDQESREVS